MPTKKSQYTKNRERIMSYIRSQRKKGIFIGINIPTERQLKKQGITGAKLASETIKLKKLTPTKLKSEHKQAKFDTETGEILEDYTVKENISKSAPTNEPNFTPPQSNIGSDNLWVSTIIGGWYSELQRFTYGLFHNFLKTFMDKLIEDNGKEAVAEALVEAGNDGVFLTWEVAYKEEAYQSYCDSLLDYLPESGDFYKDSMRDYVREHSDDFESIEDWEEPE